MTTFNVKIRATSIHIYPGMEACEKLYPLIQLLTYEDEFVEETRTLGYMLDEQHDVLFLHRGVDIDYVKRLLGNVKFEIDPYDECDKMKFEYDEIIAPRDEDQVDVINFIAGIKTQADTIDKRQLFLVKRAGFGKTYCSSVGACLYGMKTLIIMHRDQLRNQWTKSLYNMAGLSSDDVHEISSSEEVYNIAHGNIDREYDIYLMTHATFRAGLKRINDFNIAMNICKNLKIGLKIIDEAHLEFRDTLIMDFLFNVKRNIYLTATDGRSSKDENSIFKHVFSNATYYKRSSLLQKDIPKRWVEYVIVSCNTHVKPAIYRYRVAGGRGMSPASYGKWVIAYDKKQTHFRICRDLLKMIYQNDDKAKVLLFLPLIDLCDNLREFLIKDLNYDEEFGYELNIKTIHSKNTANENEKNKRADVIITTIGSCGTGTDIPGITEIICCSPYVSKVTCVQVFGRIRYCGKLCHYYDIYDESVELDRFWLRSRKRKFETMATSVKYLQWNDPDDNKDKHDS